MPFRRPFSVLAPAAFRSEEIFQLINNTPAKEIEQRDLYDRPPQLKWAEGNVCLLGDAAHPMMPNLGQGGMRRHSKAATVAAAAAAAAAPTHGVKAEP